MIDTIRSVTTSKRGGHGHKIHQKEQIIYGAYLADGMLVGFNDGLLEGLLDGIVDGLKRECKKRQQEKPGKMAK